MKIDKEYKEKLLAQIYYYNDDSWDLPDELPPIGGNIRAVCANIAYCLVDKDRFLEYYNRSEYWKRELTAALDYYRHRKYLNYYPGVSAYVNACIEGADRMREEIKLINPDLFESIPSTDYNGKDWGTVDIMLVQPDMRGVKNVRNA